MNKNLLKMKGEISPMEEIKILKVEDIRKKMGIGRDRAYALMRSKGFPAMQMGKTYYITESNFYKWLDDYAGKEFILNKGA